MQTNKLTLILGATPNPNRVAYTAVHMLKEYGHPVYLFGRKKGIVDGEKIQSVWPENQEIDTVSLYVGPKNQEEYLDRIVALKPKRVIFNPGTENPELRQRLIEAGISHEYSCTLVLLRTGQY